MASFTLNIQNDTPMVAWLDDIEMGEASWQPQYPLLKGQPITAGGSAQGTAVIAATNPLTDCTIRVRFGDALTPSVVSIEFGAQRVNDQLQPFIGAAATTPWLRPDVDVFTDPTSPDLYVGLITIRGIGPALN